MTALAEKVYKEASDLPTDAGLKNGTAKLIPGEEVFARIKSRVAV